MARDRFTKVEDDRITFDDGEWVEIKKDLNTGETKKLEAAGVKPPIMVLDPATNKSQTITPIDWETYEIERCFIYLVRWSFRNEKGPVPLTIDSIRAMDPMDFEEMNKAIFQRVLANAATKKVRRLAEEVKVAAPPPSGSESATETT